MICKKCKAQVEKGDVYCPQCGTKLKTGSKLTAGKIAGAVFMIALICVGGVYSISGLANKNSKQPDGEQLEAQAEPVQAVSVETVVEIEEELQQDTAEALPDEPDETAQYFASLMLEDIEMTIGETFQVQLEREIPDAVWTSSDDNLVRADGGQLKAVSSGKATVTLSAYESQVSFAVTVNTLPDMTLAVNCSKALELNDAISDVRWESSAPEIVSVNQNEIRSLSAGAATITAYMNGNSCSFEVVATTPDITTTSVRKIIGNTQQVSILGTNGKVEWKSDNTAIATVSDTGVITAEPSGAGQSTVVHAYVDGMEFAVDVAVEPIPQLSSTYKFDAVDKSYLDYTANVSICANANEIIAINPEISALNPNYVMISNVRNVANADYGDENVFPLYRSFGGTFFYRNNAPVDMTSHTEIYLVGTSQEAEVTVQEIGTLSNQYYYVSTTEMAEVTATYEVCENYGIIHIYDRGRKSQFGESRLVTVYVDGYTYQFVVGGIQGMPTFEYKKIESLSEKYMIEECTVDEKEVPEQVNVNHSALIENSKTYYPNYDWVERIGDKFIEAVEDQAIQMAAGALLKFIFL